MSVPDHYRLILDTNTLVRALGNRDSASGRILDLCQRREVLLLLSRPVLTEYRRVLGSPDLVRRNPQITQQAVELVLRRLRYVGDYLARIDSRFRFDRDPDDEPFIELAIAGSASHLITNDKDLLSLPDAHTDAASRLRQRLHNLHILHPADFMREYVPPPP